MSFSTSNNSKSFYFLTFFYTVCIVLLEYIYLCEFPTHTLKFKKEFYDLCSFSLIRDAHINTILNKKYIFFKCYLSKRYSKIDQHLAWHF